MPEEIRTPDQTPQMSVTDMFVGLLTSPGEVYQTIAPSEPKTSHWVVPLILAIVISVVFTIVVFTQPAIQDEMSAQQMKQFEKSIAEGKMTQEQADQAMQFSKPGSPMFMVFGSVGVVLVVAFALFAYTLAYWLAGKIAFKSTASYGKILEVYGLSYYISLVTTLVAMIMAVMMGSLYAQPSAALFVSAFDPMNTTHKLLASLNILEFWMLYVAAVGLSKVWNVSIGKAIGVVGGVWAVWTVLKVFIGIGFGG